MLLSGVYLVLMVLFVSTSTAKLGTDGERQRKALVFGGNGFIGTEIVVRLIEEGYHVTTTNRGNWYWDSPVRAKTRVHNHYPCDRDDGVLNCWDLRNYVAVVDFLDLVVDLTAYSPKIVADTCKALQGKTGLYVLISSDSVYMVCKRDENVFQDPDDTETSKPDENEGWREEHATRPHSATLRERLQEKDPYGHDKLSCEEAVAKHHQSNQGFPYVFLRLPDVLGGRDTTNRFWLYQIWLEYYQNIKLPIRFSHRMATLRTSYVFVNDVVEALVAVLRENSTAIWNRAYNVAFEEKLSLEDLLRSVQKALSIDGIEYENLPSDVEVEGSQTPVPGAIYMFPSVDFGHVDISRAKSLLKWRPTSLEVAMRNITSFYKWAFGKFPLQREKAVHTLLYQLPEENKLMFQNALGDFIKRAEREVEEQEAKRVKEEL